jgi:hypothetical protein
MEMWLVLTVRYPSAARLPLGLDGSEALAAVRMARLVGRRHEDRATVADHPPARRQFHVNTGGSYHGAAGCGPIV